MITRQHLDVIVEQLNIKLEKLGSIVEEAMINTSTVLSTRDAFLSQEVIQKDKDIDSMQKVVEDFCVQSIATQQPVAIDLRRFVGYIKIASSLERIADYARHICSLLGTIPEETISEYLSMLLEMYKMTINMLRDILPAITNLDIDTAKKISDSDRHIDALHRHIYSQILLQMDKTNSESEPRVSLITLVRVIERTGDQLSNICEHIIYIASGDHVELDL